MNLRSTLPVAALAALTLLGAAGAQVVMTAQAEESAVPSATGVDGQAALAAQGQQQNGCLQQAGEDEEAGEEAGDDGTTCQRGPQSQTGTAPANGLFQPGSAAKAATN